MIYLTGHQRATPTQRKLLRAHADSSFCSVVPEIFGSVPSLPAYQLDPTTIVALKCSYVMPHEDDWVGGMRDGDADDGPVGRRAFFWLADAPEAHTVIVQVGTTQQRMQVGDWILFDDRVLHSVFSSKLWRGCAYQVRPFVTP